VHEVWQRGGIFNMQKGLTEQLMTTATEIGQNLIVQKLQSCIAVVKECILAVCKKK